MKDNLIGLQNEVKKISMDILDLLNRRISLIEEMKNARDEDVAATIDQVRELRLIEEIVGEDNAPGYNNMIREIFSVIFNTTIKYAGLSKEKKLLVGKRHGIKPQTIQDITGQNVDLPMIIAGPCAIEQYDYLDKVAGFLASKKVKFLRGGAYKPRTSPYDFQGLREEGLKMIREIGRKYDLMTVTEVVDTRTVQLVAEYVNILQVGSRNMYNYELLKEVGRTNKPILLKRGLSATIQEFIYAAEYIALQGNNKIILCERGIRTFENKTRNTLDISSIPILKAETSLPIIADISHSLGRKDIAASIARAILAVGADGMMMEVHPYPKLAFSDNEQQLDFNEFTDLMEAIDLKYNSA
ncbi:MAG: bifunctional 3-deoxy-7-phosphoheptulonate synthase/chorismate mutase [Caulobacteraceae bacterium]